jgi:hypothetical protein
MAVRTFTVTVVSTGGGNKYFIDGVQQATVALARGATYRFDQSDSSNATHPLRFSITSDGTHGGGSEYTTGVTAAGTPGSGGAYTEIAVASNAPSPLYYYCTNHPAMGGQSNVTSDSFGALSWSIGNWNDQDNNTVSVTGIGASFSLASVASTSTVEFGWGRDGWSQRAWGNPDQIVNPSGIAMTASAGSIDPSPDAMLTGIAFTAALGNETAFTDIDVSVTGQALTSTLGNETAFSDSDIVPTGIAMTSALGDETTAGEINTGWGRLTWGENAWNIAGDLRVTGIAATAALGNESISIDASPTLTGIAMSGTTGTLAGVEISFEAALTGFGITTNLGTADAGPDAMLTGIGATAALGTLDAFNQTGWGRQGWNVNAWGVEGQFASGNVNGIAMSANIGTLAATGDGSVVPTGISITAAEGDVDPGPDASVTGIGFSGTLAVGTVVAGGADVTVTGTGFAAGLGLGTLFAESLIDVTGIAMTANLGTVSTKGFATVSLTGIGLTMNLNSVNSLVWNEVNTGSAPLDPPGWVEVPTRAA